MNVFNNFDLNSLRIYQTRYKYVLNSKIKTFLTIYLMFKINLLTFKIEFKISLIPMFINTVFMLLLSLISKY